MLEDKLPRKPSELLDLVAKDWSRLSRDKYLPRSGTWHCKSNQLPEMCLVCDAGAVMAGTLKIPSDFRCRQADTLYERVSRRDAETLRAIDYMRTGCYPTALFLLGYLEECDDYSLTQSIPKIPHENFNFWSQIDTRIKVVKEAADAFRAKGL